MYTTKVTATLEINCNYIASTKPDSSILDSAHLPSNELGTVQVIPDWCTPPNLASDVLRSFDEEVKQCFAQCSATEVPNETWYQAQLRHKCGGLGLHSVSLDDVAAFLASVSSTRFDSADSIHLSRQ